MTLTAQQRIDALLTADFFADDRGRIATRQDVLDALLTGPMIPHYIPRPVSLPMPREVWRAV